MRQIGPYQSGARSLESLDGSGNIRGVDVLVLSHA